MRILFVEHIQIMLGMESLSAYLKRAGHEVDCFFEPGIFADSLVSVPTLAKIFNTSTPLIDHIEKTHPDLICFSVVTDHYRWAIERAFAIKSRFDIPIAFGGIHPTSVPEYVLENEAVDFVVVGEGEDPLVELANALQNREPVEQIMNLGFMKNGQMQINPLRPLIENLDSLPFPDKDITYPFWLKLYDHRYHTIGSRGCPNRCTYCCHSFLPEMFRGLGRYYRKRSAENLVEELAKAKEKYDLSAILLHDNSLTQDRKWFRHFAQLYKKHVELPYFCWVSPNNIDEESVGLLKDSGCINVWMGATIVPTKKNDLIRRRRFNQAVSNALDLFRTTNIYVVADNLVNLPSQTEEDLIEMIRLYLDHPADQVVAFYVRYYPRIELIKTALEMNALSRQDIVHIEKEGGTPSFLQSDVQSNDRISRLSNLLVLSMILPRRIIEWILAKPERLRFVPKRSVWQVTLALVDLYRQYTSGRRRMPLISGMAGTARFYLMSMIKRKV